MAAKAALRIVIVKYKSISEVEAKDDGGRARIHSELRRIRSVLERKHSQEHSWEVVMESPQRVWRKLKSSITRKGGWR